VVDSACCAFVGVAGEYMLIGRFGVAKASWVFVGVELADGVTKPRVSGKHGILLRVSGALKAEELTNVVLVQAQSAHTAGCSIAILFIN
jgi:hypothetical protein